MAIHCLPLILLSELKYWNSNHLKMEWKPCIFHLRGYSAIKAEASVEKPLDLHLRPSSLLGIWMPMDHRRVSSVCRMPDASSKLFKTSIGSRARWSFRSPIRMFFPFCVFLKICTLWNLAMAGDDRTRRHRSAACTHSLLFGMVGLRSEWVGPFSFNIFLFFFFKWKLLQRQIFSTGNVGVERTPSRHRAAFWRMTGMNVLQELD